MNHQQTVDHELRLYNQFKAEGKQLLHFCPDWDDMAIHSEMDEIACCCCDFELESDKILRDQKATEVETRRMRDSVSPPMLIQTYGTLQMKPANFMKKSTSQDFSSVGAPAHSGTELDNEVALVCMIVSNDALKRPGWQKRVNDLLRGMRDRILELEKQQ